MLDRTVLMVLGYGWLFIVIYREVVNWGFHSGYGIGFYYMYAHVTIPNS